MLLAGNIVGLLALIDLLIGIAWLVVYQGDFGSWTTVIAHTPLFIENEGLMNFLRITFGGFLVTGVLQLVSSNNRYLWTLSLIGKLTVFTCSIVLGYYIFINEMRSEAFLERQLVALFQLYNTSQPIAHLLDRMHGAHECCGYYSDHREWPKLIGPNRVPDSCCQPWIKSNGQPGCGVNDQSAWLSRLHNAACHAVIWGAYDAWDPLALLFYWMLVYLMWLGVILNFYKVFLASYLASEVTKYLRSMDALAG